MKIKFKTIEEGIDYALENNISSFEVGGKAYFVEDVDDISKYDNVPIYECGGTSGYINTDFMRINGGQVYVNTPLAKNGFFSRLGKGIKNVARGVGNVAHDWGMGIADSFGNSTGMFDIDNDRYKTQFGRSVSGFNDKLQSTTGKIGRSIASAAVPGVSGLTNAMGGASQQQSQQEQGNNYYYSFPQNTNNNFDQLRMLMGFAPMLLGTNSPLASGKSSSMIPGFFQNGGNSDEEFEMHGLRFRKPKYGNGYFFEVGDRWFPYGDYNTKEEIESDVWKKLDPENVDYMKKSRAKVRTRKSYNGVDEGIPYDELIGKVSYPRQYSNKYKDENGNFLEDEWMYDLWKYRRMYGEESMTESDAGFLNEVDDNVYRYRLMEEVNNPKNKKNGGMINTKYPISKYQDGNPVVKKFSNTTKMSDQDNYLADLQQYVMNYGIDALEKTDPAAADFYKEEALKVVSSTNVDGGEDDEVLLPELIKTAPRPKKKKDEQEDSKEYDFNPFLEMTLPKSKSDFLLQTFGIKFSDIGRSSGNKREDSLANLTSILKNLISKQTQVSIYDPRNMQPNDMVFGPNAYARNGLMVQKYKQGGTVFNKDLVANDDSMAKHYLPLPLMIPIQTEIKETIVLPTGDLVKVNAKKRHSKMTDNEVTDMVPENSYILSQFGDTKIYKDEAKQIVMEVKAEPYNLHKASGVPKVKTLGDMMNKNVMSPADLSRVVENKFKIIDNGNDPFTLQTNEANRFNRTAYLQAIIGLSEFDKARKGIDNSISAQTQAGQLPQMVARQGGFARPLTMGRGILPKAQDPVSTAVSAGGAGMDWVSVIPQTLSTLFSIGTNIADRRRLARNQRLNSADISKYGSTARQNAGLSAMAQSLFTAIQDPTVIPELKDVSYLDSINNMNMAYLNNVSNRLTTDAFNNRMDTSSMSPQAAMYLAGRDNAQRYEALSKASADLAKTRADLFTKYLMTRGELLNENAVSRTKASNATRAGVNAKYGTLGGIFSGYLDNMTGISKNVLEAEMANRGNYAVNLSALNRSLDQTIQNSANVAQQLYAQSQKNRGTETRTNTPGTTTSPNQEYKCVKGKRWYLDVYDGTYIQTNEDC